MVKCACGHLQQFHTGVYAEVGSSTGHSKNDAGCVFCDCLHFRNSESGHGTRSVTPPLEKKRPVTKKTGEVPWGRFAAITREIPREIAGDQMSLHNVSLAIISEEVAYYKAKADALEKQNETLLEMLENLATRQEPPTS